MLAVTTGLDVACARPGCGHSRHDHEAGWPYTGCVHRHCGNTPCDGFVVPSWDYRERTRLDDIEERLQRIEELTMGKAKDDDKTHEQSQALFASLKKDVEKTPEQKSRDLFDSLKKDVEDGKK